MSTPSMPPPDDRPIYDPSLDDNIDGRSVPSPKAEVPKEEKKVTLLGKVLRIVPPIFGINRKTVAPPSKEEVIAEKTSKEALQQKAKSDLRKSWRKSMRIFGTEKVAKPRELDVSDKAAQAEKLVVYLRTHGGERQNGLFRIPGTLVIVTKILEDMDKKSQESNSLEGLEIEDIHKGATNADAASALKQLVKQSNFSSEFREALRAFGKAAATISPDEQANRLNTIIQLLNQDQQRLLKSVVNLCRSVTDNVEHTKMTPANLGTCLGPNLEAADATPAQIMDFRPFNDAFASLVTHASKLQWDKIQTNLRG